jgi:SAM-dependent methyltransferase
MTATPRPANLGPSYAAQFSDEGVADAYRYRPSYPAAIIDWLRELIPPEAPSVVDIGCGTGELARRLAPFVEHVDAVDMSAAMLARGRLLKGGDHPSLSWIEARVEAASIAGPYGLAVAGESLHWMDWETVLPRLARWLRPQAVLAIANRTTEAAEHPDQVRALIRRYSANQEYRAFDLVGELTQRRLFTEAGRRETSPAILEMPLEDFVESMHSRNGFCRTLMGSENAEAFDTELESLLRPTATAAGCVRIRHSGTLAWGWPASRGIDADLQD